MQQEKGTPCAKKSDWKTYVSPKYGFRIKYPADCFPAVEEYLNGVGFVGDGKRFHKVEFVENEVPQEDHLGPPSKDWIAALKAKEWGYGIAWKGETLGAVVSLTSTSHAIFTCDLIGKRTSNDPRISICEAIRASMEKT